MFPTTKRCPECQGFFQTRRARQRFCSIQCRVRGGSRGSLNCGAASELFVCAAITRRGWCAFRNTSPTGPVDLIAYHPDYAPILIDVKTGDTGNGKPLVPGVKIVPVLWTDTGPVVDLDAIGIIDLCA